MNKWKKGEDYPEWYKDRSLQVISKGYLLDKETPKDAYRRVANAAASRLQMPDLAEDFFQIMWKGWLGPASPVLSNMGTDRGLPISCFSLSIPDSVDGIYKSVHEMAMMTKYGGGVGVYAGNIRGRGEIIKGNGKSEGVIPWLKVFDSAILATSQGSVRRGAAASYLPIEHTDIEEFLRMRRPEGDINRHCMNLHHAVTISDEFMKKVESGDKESRSTFKEVIKNRFETGEPFILFSDNANKQNPECYIKHNLSVKTSNICCLSGDTKVLTKQGILKIKDIVGKEVTIFDGNSWVNNSSFELKGVDSLYRVHLSDGSYVDCTKNHRWFVSESYKEISAEKVKEVLTSNLKPGTWLEYHKEEYSGDIEEPGAYLKGFLVGDGTFDSKNPILNVHSTKFCCIDYLKKSGSSIKVECSFFKGFKEIGFSKVVDNTGRYSGVYGIQRFVRTRGLSARRNSLLNWTKSYKKNLPEEIQDWTKTSKLEFIAGLFDADGTVGARNLVQISSKYRSFLEDLQLLLKSVGIWSNIDKSENAYRLSLSSKDGYSLLNSAPFQRLKPNDKEPNRVLTGWRKVVKVEDLGYKDEVYCPKVESTGKFALANGVMTGNSEIFLHTDDDHSFVCCLSSLNLHKYEEWEDWKSDAGKSLVELTTYFLDAVMQEFIEKGQSIPGLERSIRFAKKGRALGIGVMGFHSLLQKREIPFDSFQSKNLNRLIFKKIKEQSEKASKELASIFGEPEWCKGFGIRNTHLMALAPTVSNSTICGGVSPSIEPWVANAFNQKSAKGTFLVKNPELEKLLEFSGNNTKEVWSSIVEMNGSVQHLEFLTDKQKEVYLTAREIDQIAIVDLAGDRQEYIDQGQSLNLFFDVKADPRYVYQVHLRAWKRKIKSLYYMRTGSVLKANFKLPSERTEDDCKSCEG